ncbi:hypothetical protein [Lactiplantibacillus plantarum]|uniref:hypothetical protein n=1 Tax=Lactiplantibacillus plantarum TaxID=1590 RepID=UPI003BA1AAEA
MNRVRPGSDQILAIVRDNYHAIMHHLCRPRASKLVLADLQGTYLTWLDLRAYVQPAATKAFIQDQCQLAVDFGEWFSPDDQGFVRLNLATNPQNVREAAQRIVTCLSQMQK